MTGLNEKNAAGQTITYTVKEDPTIASYIPTITGNATSGYTITNSHTPEVTSISVTKKWVGPTGSAVTVKLLANGSDSGKTLTLDAAGNWTGTFSNLPKYKDGAPITYTVTEASVTGVDMSKYTVAITGDATTGFTITNTNTEKVSVSGTKTWNDNNNQDGKRPTSITVNLLKNGTKVDSKTVTPDVSGAWTYSFSSLDKYNADGTEITYSVSEDSVDGYTSTVTGTNITNSYTPETTVVKVTKAWVGPKTNSVNVHLLADGTDTGKTLTLNETGNWTGTFDGLRKYKTDGTEIKYTVKEDDITNYTSATTGDATTGFTITNTNTEKVDVPVKKEWVGPKAGPVTVHLLADGTDTGKSITLDEAGNWTGTFSGLDKYKADGTEIVYTIKEDEVSGYTSEVTGDATTGFTITNTEVSHDTPKPKEDTPKKSNRKPAKKSGGVVPHTGDSNATGIAIALASAAVVLIGGGVYLRRRGQHK